MKFLWVLLIWCLTNDAKGVRLHTFGKRIFSSHLICAPKYETADKIECKFHLTNNGKQDYSVLKWHTPLDGLKSDCLTVISNGKKLQYDGIYLRRSAPGPDQYLLIKAGKTVSSTFDVSDAYDMTKAGLYSIAVDTNLEYLAGSLSEGRVTQAEVGHLSSPAVSYKISKGSFSKGTLGERARSLKRTNQLSMRSSPCPDNGADDFVGGSKWLRNSTKKAFKIAIACMNLAIKYLKDKPEEAKEWFGTASEKAKGLLKETVGKLQDKWHITFDFKGDQCSDQIIAYTFYEACSLYLCKAYKKKKTFRGKDSKMSTIVHQLTHAITNTADYAHGPERVKKLASDKPERAASNAANYAHLVESLPLKCLLF